MYHKGRLPIGHPWFAILPFSMLYEDLLSMGFQPNPYDPCVVNEEIDGSQMTITWPVYDLKVSHKV